MSKRDDLEIVIGANLEGLAADLAKGARMVKGFARELDRSTPRGKDMTPAGDYRELARGAGAARAAGGGFRAAAADIGAFAGKAAIAGGTLLALEAGFSGVGDALRHVKEAVAMAADLEQTTLAFDVMLNSAERAKEMVSGLRKFAAETPFNSREVTGAGKQLLAYGIAADQVIPSLKMLGDVSAAFGKDLPLKDLTYLYGTLYAQQRAYAVDIRQFAGRGIPIYEELAKVIGKSVAEVKELVEAGLIGRDEVTQAFISMTSAGGRFFNMTKRQAETLSGLWEQMTDAFDLAKTRLGQIIIEEVGLKDVVRDLEKFGKKLELGVDTKGIREGIRFAGDLVKGVANVGYELGKAAVTTGDIFGQMAREIPIFKETLGTVQSIVDGMKEFKFNPEDVVDFAVALSKETLQNASALLTTVAEVGSVLKKDFYDPLKSAVGDFKELAEIVRGGWIKTRKAGEFIGDFFTKSPQQIALEQMVPRAVEVPIEKPKGDDPFAGLRNSAAKLAKNFDAIDEIAFKIKTRLFEEKLAKQEDERDALTKRNLAESNAKFFSYEAIKNAVRQNDFGGLSALGSTNPLVALAGGAKGFRSEFAIGAVPDVLAKIAPLYFRGLRAMSDVRLQGDLSPGAADLHKRIREKYDPLNENGELMRTKKDLDQLLARDMISPQQHDAEWRDAVRGVADRVGAGQPAKLTDAVLVGSHEDARLLNNFYAGQQQQTTEDLLRQIRDILSLKLGKMVESPAPRPANISPF